MTLRWTHEGRERAEGVWAQPGQGAMMCFWHARIPMSPTPWDKKAPQTLYALVSKSADGELIRKAGVMSIVLDSGRVRPGDAIAIELADDLDVGKGNVIVVNGAHQPVDASGIVADVCWFTDTELTVGDAIVVRHASGEVNARVAAITHRLDLDTLENTPTDRLVLNDIGRVELALASPLVVDEYLVNRAGGSAIAIDPVTNATIGALMIRSGY